MKIFTILSLIFFVNTGYCFEINNIKNVFKSLLNAEPKVDQDKKHCCDPTVEEIEQMNQCAIDLCGNSGTVDSSYISNEDYENYYKDEGALQDYNEFKPKLKKYLDVVREQARKEIEAIKDKSQQNNGTYYNLDSYSDDQISSIMSDELSSNIQVEIKKDRNGDKKVSVMTLPSDISLDEELKKKYIEFKTNQIKTNFSEGLYSGYLNLEDAMSFIKDAIQKHLEEIEKKLSSASNDDASNRSVLEGKREQYKDIKNQVDNTKELTKEIVSGFYSSIQWVDYQLTSSLNLKYFNVSYEEFKCGDLKCRDYLARKIPSLMKIDNLNEIIKQTNDDKKANELIGSCEYFWHEDKLKKAKEGKKQDFINSIPEKLKTLKSNFTSKFSKESSESLDKYFNNLKYVVADDPIPDRGDFNHLDYIKERVQKVVEPKEEENQTDNNEDQLKGVLADYKKLKNHFMLGQVRFEHELTACEEADNMAGDHFNPDEYDPDTYVHISSFSCNHYTTGKKVFAHELGHAISGQFLHHKTSESSYSKYKGHRDCVSETYKERDFAGTPMWKEFAHAGDTKYTEEDMADFVASIVYPDPNESLLSCALIKKDKNNIDYDRKELSVLNSISFDTHSSPFLRTLKEAISKNRVLTDSCQKIIDRYRDRINFNRCEFK
jgi:hypothetical protein